MSIYYNRRSNYLFGSQLSVGNDFSFAELAIGSQFSYYSNYIDYVLEGEDIQMDVNKSDRWSFCFGSSDIVNIKALSNNASNTINSEAIYFEISRKF